MTEFNNGEEACFLNDFLCQLNGGPSVFPARTPLAMAYVPSQEFEDLYDASAALENGTLFKILNFPFEQAFGPQTAYAADGSSPWEWVQGAWPWQNDMPDGGRR